MNNELLDTGLFFNASKKEQMQEILDIFYDAATQNPSFKITRNVIYNHLRYGLLPTHEKDIRNDKLHGIKNRQFFSRWENDFKGRRNIDAFCDEYGWPYWFQFKNRLPIQDSYIKLYVPINAQHLYKGVYELFDFIEKEKIVHSSRVAEEARTDNVIIRLDDNDKESARKIIDFIENNKYLSTGLNTINPFVPSISGVGCMNEHSNSYNMEIAVNIESYLNKCLDNKTRPNIDEFRNFIKTYSSDKDLIETFENAYLGRTEFKPKEQRTTEVGLSLEQKTYLLIDALKATYMKYDLTQVREALKHAIAEEDYNYFTNGDGFQLRNKLLINVKPEDMLKIIKFALPNFINPRFIAKDVEGKINQFTDILFQDDLVLSLDEACQATLEKYGLTSLVHAIYKYMNGSDPSGFTRFTQNDRSINYREQIIKINPNDLMYYLKKSLMLKGYDAEDELERDIPHIYAEVIKSSRYTSLSDSPKISK